MVQHSQGTGSQQSQNNQRKIQGWLMGEGWQGGEERPPEALWAWSATDKGGRKLVVAQRSDRPDMILIQAGIITGDNVRRHISAMNLQERRAFYLDLQYTLLQMGVEYTNIADPFEMVSVVQRIYSEALVRDAFIQRIILIRNAQVMILLKIGSLMNEPPIAPTEPPPMGFQPS
ncbi:DUF2299 family protein [Chloroflexota bacterium]